MQVLHRALRAQAGSFSLSRTRAFSTRALPQGRTWSGAAALFASGALLGATALCAGEEKKGNVAPPTLGVDYAKVYAAISGLLDELDHDDGSFGPVFVRLAWHAAGTYSKPAGDGGSDGATMRFKREASWGANAGLSIARERLEGVKRAFPGLTYADLWSLAGVVAIQEMGGPVIPWRPGRYDAPDDEAKVVPDGRLPDATQGAGHLRAVFGRMGFTDEDIVALSGAHALGRCHADRSGFDGPWTRSPTTFSSDYFKLLLSETWVLKKTHTNAKGEVVPWTGPLQYEDAATASLMMLPTDLALIKDAALRPFVALYAANQDAFFADFVTAFVKLQENGVAAFKGEGGAKPLTFKRL
jgi:cytochrome c peroxidase